MGRRNRHNNNYRQQQQKNSHNNRVANKLQKARDENKKQLQKLELNIIPRPSVHYLENVSYLDYIKMCEPEFIECIWRIRCLPWELQDIIWKQYWRYKYTHTVIYDLKIMEEQVKYEIYYPRALPLIRLDPGLLRNIKEICTHNYGIFTVCVLKPESPEPVKYCKTVKLNTLASMICRHVNPILFYFG